MAQPAFDARYELADRYRIRSGRVFLTGNQALVRLPLMQRQRDQEAGLNTEGFISGYRGSPLGIFDMNLWQARAELEAHRIKFEPGLNEDLAATMLFGTQQATLMERSTVDGVFGLWYGKGPGVDRSCDALKHANYAGTSQYGGVLALMGDDPGAKSSSIAHQSEPAMIHCGIPVLNPANIQDYLDFGIYGWALSRYSGCWIGFKCLTDTIESSGSVEVSPDRVEIALPTDYEPPPGGLHVGWANIPLAVEERLFEHRLVALSAFVRANPIDRIALESPRRRLGIVTTGKAYGDLRQALEDIGLGDAEARELGISIYKVGLVWPLEREGARAFARGRGPVGVVVHREGNRLELPDDGPGVSIKAQETETVIDGRLGLRPPVPRPSIAGRDVEVVTAESARDRCPNAATTSAGCAEPEAGDQRSGRQIDSGDPSVLDWIVTVISNTDVDPVAKYERRRIADLLMQFIGRRWGKTIEHGNLRRLPNFGARGSIQGK